MKIGIYIIKNKINNKVYIGKSQDIERRFREHIIGRKTAVLLARAIKKYGLENFEFSIIEECPKDMLANREEYYIDLYRSRDRKYGYNIAKGGSGGDTITNLPKDKYNDYINKLSKPRPKKFREEQSERFRGSRNPMYGKTMSSQTTNKMRESHKGKIWINNGVEQKQINQSDISNYNGWSRGMLSKKSATTIEITTEKKDLR